MQDHAIRIFCAVSCSLLIIVAFSSYERVLALQRNLDIFTYVGTAATLVGLIVAICEVLNGLRVSRSIQKEAQSMLSHANLVDAAAGISQCLAALDDVLSHVNLDDYRYAWSCFVHFRKTCVKIFPQLLADEDRDGLNAFGQIEAVFSYALNRGVPGYLSKGQKIELVKKLLQVKQEIETSNPAGRRVDVAV